jgi:hypothetical protein
LNLGHPLVKGREVPGSPARNSERIPQQALERIPLLNERPFKRPIDKRYKCQKNSRFRKGKNSAI